MHHRRLGCLPALAASIGIFLIGVAKADPEKVDPTALADIRISFKLDPRLTRAMYMGERWVSMPTFTSTVQPGQTCSVDVAAQGVDGRGKPLDVSPAWKPADPEMLAVTPPHGTSVAITALRPGETSLEVTAAGFTKRLFIKATALYEDSAMQMEISH